MKTRLIVTLVAGGLALAACGGDPTEGEKSEGDTITVGSAAFPENEIIAEIYAQALEAEGVKVAKKLNIGAREAYIPALENGEIDLLPEYSGNLLTYFDKEATASSSEEIITALEDTVPDGLDVLEPAPAEDKDSLNVTPEFSEKNGVTSIADLADVDGLKLAAPPEFEERANGLPGLEREYGLADVEFTGISDGGGPATLKALLDGKVDVANIFTTTPSIAENDLVTLEDPKNLFPAQNVVPLINKEKASGKVMMLLNAISAKLTTEDLLELNGKNQGEDKAAPAELAKQWLADKGLS